MQIGVIGGTGPAGQGIAVRLAALGHDVVIGSRDRARGESIVESLRAKWGDRATTLRGGDNGDAATADLVVLATVAEASVETAAAHADALVAKVVVAMGNAMEKGSRELVPVDHPEGSLSAAVQAAAPKARVVAALQHIPASELEDLDAELHSDVLVAGGDDEARETVMDLINEIPGLRAFDAGSLANAAGIEALTAALITVNIRHRGQASVHLSGVEPRATKSSKK